MSTNEEITVGRFTLTSDDSLLGPADYMREQGNAKLDAMIAGNDPAFNIALNYQPDYRRCLLVMLQTDYAGWKGMRQFVGALER